MADLISRNALMAHFKQDEWGTPDERWRPEREFGRMVLNAPTVDAVPLADYKSMEQTVNKLTKALAEAEPIKHGRWIIKTYPVEHTGLIEISVWECTACGHPFWSDTPYCPICGAKMDGEEREDAD